HRSGKAAFGLIQQADRDVAELNELAGRAGERPARIEPWHRRHLSADSIRPDLEDDVVPLGMDREVVDLVARGDVDVVRGQDQLACRMRRRVVERVPRRLFEEQRSAALERVPKVTGARDDTDRDPPCGIDLGANRHALTPEQGPSLHRVVMARITRPYPSTRFLGPALRAARPAADALP